MKKMKSDIELRIEYWRGQGSTEQEVEWLLRDYDGHAVTTGEALYMLRARLCELHIRLAAALRRVPIVGRLF